MTYFSSKKSEYMQYAWTENNFNVVWYLDHWFGGVAWGAGQILKSVSFGDYAITNDGHDPWPADVLGVDEWQIGVAEHDWHL